ncbi:hypothetical protein [Pontiella agarivorans]|uniref:Uncharacterized protein n=1 Tax=Pontiella agarivorans TaxID=3038953 RepID=A0ABU5MX75_9BACT|nr:hypothetical protein [Pontiella agarivorans]MDZ8118757.1 hypothetical protein [Pontiella agarivorans]
MKVTGVQAGAVKELGGGVVEIALEKGGTAVLSDASYTGDFVIRPVEKKFSAD